ncbi:MAG: hypothetical protein ACE5G0_21880 [Rhodothermales bacterium]
MAFIYDHLTATILGISIFFLLVAVQLRSTETSRDQARYYSAKTQVLNVKEMIEYDFENVGTGVAKYDPIFVSKTDSTFTFMEKVLPTDPDPSTVMYRRVPREVVTIEGEEVQLYEIQRLVEGVVTGKSPPTMKEFDVTLLNSNREVETNLTAVRAIQVRFTVLSPLGNKNELHEARWNRTFWPPNLTNF